MCVVKMIRTTSSRGAGAESSLRDMVQVPAAAILRGPHRGSPEREIAWIRQSKGPLLKDKGLLGLLGRGTNLSSGSKRRC